MHLYYIICGAGAGFKVLGLTQPVPGETMWAESDKWHNQIAIY